jgi:hypothetical protein
VRVRSCRGGGRAMMIEIGRSLFLLVASSRRSQSTCVQYAAGPTGPAGAKRNRSQRRLSTKICRRPTSVSFSSATRKNLDATKPLFLSTMAIAPIRLQPVIKLSGLGGLVRLSNFMLLLRAVVRVRSATPRSWSGATVASSETQSRSRKCSQMLAESSSGAPCTLKNMRFHVGIVARRRCGKAA